MEQNFLLAIVVEAYMAVAEENKVYRTQTGARGSGFCQFSLFFLNSETITRQVMETEQDFVSDLAACFYARFMAVKYGWPNYSRLGKMLHGWNVRLSVGFKDMQRTNLFPNQQSIAHFIKYYSSFDFCEPPHVSKIGIIGGDDKVQYQEMAMVFENLLHKFFNGKVPKLKDVAREGLQKADQRRADKVYVCSEQII